MVKDFLGNELKEGDIVLRCKFSSFTFHKIVKFTKKRIKLTCKRLTRHYGSQNQLSYQYLTDSVEVNDITNHNEFMYISKSNHNGNKVLNLIKYENNNIKV